jgi:excinuclease ABC subunit B
MSGTEVTIDGKLVRVYVEPEALDVAADPVVQYMNKDELKKQIAKAKSAMLRAAKEMNFNEAARLRDEMYSLEKMLGEKE